MPRLHVLPVSVLAELRALPPLDGAACRGHGGLWDDDHPGESAAARDARHAEAARISRWCHARYACANLAATYPPGEIRGVWAGRLQHPRPPGHGAA